MIKKLLKQNRHVSVTELSLCLNVSEVTIRRDLEKLESERFLMRTHGGAVIRDDSSPAPMEEYLDLPETTGDSVQQIARLGADLIQDGSIIYLDGGPISMAIARLLSDKQDLIVLTCSMPVATELSKIPTLRTIIPGGQVFPSGLIYGPNTHSTFNTLHVGTAFIEPTGFSCSGFTVREQNMNPLIQAIGQISDRVIFLCSPQAYGHISFFHIGSLSLADSILTAVEVDDTFKDACLRSQIKLFTAYDL